MRYLDRSFTVPATLKSAKTPCVVHHIVKGKCLRCDVVVRYDLTSGGRAELTDGSEGAE